MACDQMDIDDCLDGRGGRGEGMGVLLKMR
jgi:hypothetical protein